MFHSGSLHGEGAGAGRIAFGGYTASDLNQDVYIGTVDRMGRNPSRWTDVSATATGDCRDDGGLTVEPGTLSELVSPTTVDWLVESE